MAKVLISITVDDKNAMMDLLHTQQLEIIRQTAQMLRKGQGYTVDAIVEADQVETLRGLGYRVEVKEDIEKLGRARQALVGKGDRFRDRSPK